MSRIFLSHGSVFHARHGEKKNSFRYPVFSLFMNCSDEQEVQHIFKSKFKRLLSFKSNDFLHGAKSSLHGAVTDFLRSNCTYEAEEVWLQTFPRMFGYAFNPISFWFCKKQGQLDAVLCEVNNTFGERHFYWLNPEGGVLPGEWLRSQKVFHVSPFFPVDGYYEFRFAIGDKQSRVDICYFNSQDVLQLTTWIEGKLYDLKEQSPWRLVLQYGWMTPLVVMRIHFQALRLWRKKVRFFSKPSSPTKEVT